jgi:hypothetical protein
VSDFLSEAAARTYAWFGILPTQGVNVTREGQLAKVRNEAIEFCDDPCLEEAADVFITLIGSLQVFGWSITELAVAVDTKMAINEKRKWARLDDGSYQHTED